GLDGPHARTIRDTRVRNREASQHGPGPPTGRLFTRPRGPRTAGPPAESETGRQIRAGALRAMACLSFISAPTAARANWRGRNPADAAQGGVSMWEYRQSADPAPLLDPSAPICGHFGGDVAQPPIAQTPATAVVSPASRRSAAHRR